MAVILFIFENKARLGDISSNNVYIVSRVNGLRPKLGNMGVHRGQNLSTDIYTFA